MKLTKETLNEAMSGISARLITEAAPDSPELRERRAWVYAVRAAAAALVFTAVIFAALKLRPDGGNTVTPGDVPGEGERSSVAVIDGLEFPITYTLDGLAPDSDGTITSVSVSAPEGYEAKFSDTQGQCFESMLLEVTHGGERFCVVCDIRSGNVNDFMREAEYRDFSSNVAYSWDTLTDDGVGAVTWRYDKTGVTFIAAAKDAPDSGKNGMRVYALWAFDPRKPRGSGSIFGCELKDTRGKSYFGSNLSLFPKNGSFALSSGDGGMFAVLWDDSVGETDADDIRDIYDFAAVEATELLPRILDSEYKLEYTEKRFVVVVKFKDGGVECAYEIDLRDGSMKDVSDTPEPTDTNTPDDTYPPEETKILFGTDPTEAYEFFPGNMCLVRYKGSARNPVVPQELLKIGPNAFAEAQEADKIVKITLGKDTDHIDTKAFFGLPSLESVEIDADNPSYRSEKLDETSSVLYGIDEKIIFYISPEGLISDKLYDVLPDFYMNDGAEVTFVCGNAVLDIFYPGKTPEGDENFTFYCRSITYDGRTVSFDEPVPFGKEMNGTRILESARGELVFETNCFYNAADIYYVTASTPSAIELHGIYDRTVSFYLDDKNELRYRAIKTGFDILDQTMGGDAFYVITGRDDYYGEDGRVSVKNGEFELERENLYTISDYFKMNGTDIDTAFRDLGFDEYYGSLENLFEENRKKTGAD